MQSDRPHLQVFVCMKTRQDGRPACANAGGGEVLEALRKELDKKGQTTSHIHVRPCGCVDRCEKGPVILAFTGSMAEADSPPKSLLGKLMYRPTFCFERVSAADVPAIVEQLTAKKPCTTA
jgi:(2Fe-2S) ferredoxin